MRCLAVTLLLAWPAALCAQSIGLPSNAVQTSSESEPLTSFDVAIGEWTGTMVPTQVFEGDLSIETWRIPSQGLSTLQILRPLRSQLRDAGYEILLDCDTQTCGGFDFRFDRRIALPPAMHVNLRDFRFVSAQLDETAVELMISRSDSAGFVQIARIEPGAGDDPIADTSEPALRMSDAAGGDTTTLTAALDQSGRAILSGLTFERGSSQLASGEFETLSELAEFLTSNPDVKVTLVGHTDAEGSLSGNIALSKRRAASVLERLVSDYGVSRQRVSADGIGYLAPIVTNQTPEGREANRRVEVIIDTIPN